MNLVFACVLVWWLVLTVLCVSGIFRFTVVCWFSEFQLVCAFGVGTRQNFVFVVLDGDYFFGVVLLGLSVL